MLRATLALVAAAAVLAVPATAAAKLPTIAKANRKIVVGKSIAGVKLGDTLKRAKAVWGAGSKCQTTAGNTSCTWDGGTKGTAWFIVKAVKVIQITIAQKQNGVKYYPSPALSLVKFGKIALGTPEATLTSTYKFPYLNVTGNQNYSIYTSDHKVETAFAVSRDYKQNPIWNINMTKYP